MITLQDKDTGQQLGQISDEDLQFLINALEEESLSDTDYYISGETIDLLAERGASTELVSLLRSSLGGREGVEIVWSRK
jgi:hypothetical protein